VDVFKSVEDFFSFTRLCITLIIMLIIILYYYEFIVMHHINIHYITRQYITIFTIYCMP